MEKLLMNKLETEFDKRIWDVRLLENGVVFIDLMRDEVNVLRTETIYGSYIKSRVIKQTDKMREFIYMEENPSKTMRIFYHIEVDPYEGVKKLLKLEHVVDAYIINDGLYYIRLLGVGTDEIYNSNERYLMSDLVTRYAGGDEDIKTLAGCEVLEDDDEPVLFNPYIKIQYGKEDLKVQIESGKLPVSYTYNIYSFIDQVKEGKQLIDIAEYYEKHGGYYINGVLVQDCCMDHADEACKLVPNAIRKRLLDENNLVEVRPEYALSPCRLLGKTVDELDLRYVGDHTTVFLIDSEMSSRKECFIMKTKGRCLGIEKIGCTFVGIFEDYDESLGFNVKTIQFFEYREGVLIDCTWGCPKVSEFCQLTDNLFVSMKGDIRDFRNNGRRISAIDFYSDTPDDGLNGLLFVRDKGGAPDGMIKPLRLIFITRNGMTVYALYDFEKGKIYGKVYDDYTDSMFSNIEDEGQLEDLSFQNEEWDHIVRNKVAKIPP